MGRGELSFSYYYRSVYNALLKYSLSQQHKVYFYKECPSYSTLFCEVQDLLDPLEYQIVWLKSNGMPVSSIQKVAGMTRSSYYRLYLRAIKKLRKEYL